MKVLKASTQNKVRKLIASFDKKIDATAQAYAIKGKKISAKKVQGLAQEIQALYAGLKKLSTASKKSFLAAAEDDEYLATLEDIAKVATKLDLIADLIEDEAQDSSDNDTITTEDILNEIQPDNAPVDDASVDSSENDASVDSSENDNTDAAPVDATVDMDDDDALVEDSSENDNADADEVDMDDDALVEDSSENDDTTQTAADDDATPPMFDDDTTPLSMFSNAKQARRKKVTVKKQTASRKVMNKTSGVAGAKLFNFVK